MKRKLQVSLLHWYQASGQSLPAWLQRACERDPVLASEKEAGHSLTSALRHDFQPRSIEPSPYLASRIKRSLNAVQNGEKTSAGAASLLTWTGAAAGIGLLVVVAFVVLRRGLVPEEPQPTATVASTTESIPSPASARTDLITTAVVDSTAAVMGSEGPWANPLRQELTNVVADARGAMRFLASNFLPSAMTDDAVSPETAHRPAG